MNILDIIIIIVLLMFVITGFKRGVFRELVSLVGTILMFIIAYILKTPIGNFMCRVLPFFELPDGNNIYNVLLFQILAFIIVFALLLSFYEVFVSFSESIQKVINITIVLWLPSKILGSVVAFVKGLIIIFLVLLLVMVPTKGKELIDNSMLAPKILDETPVLSDMSKDYTSSIKEIYALAIHSKKLNNQEVIDIMLKYKIIDEKTIQALTATNKIQLD